MKELAAKNAELQQSIIKLEALSPNGAGLGEWITSTCWMFRLRGCVFALLCSLPSCGRHGRVQPAQIRQSGTGERAGRSGR